MLNIDTAKSYATEENLLRTLAKLQLDDRRFIVVRNRQGRWTAIFPYVQPDKNIDGLRPAHLGFCVLG